jgi:hypothetical protein
LCRQIFPDLQDQSEMMTGSHYCEQLTYLTLLLSLTGGISRWLTDLIKSGRACAAAWQAIRTHIETP